MSVDQKPTTTPDPKTKGRKSARDVFLVSAILLLISVFMFTFGALIGRQLIMAEFHAQGMYLQAMNGPENSDGKPEEKPVATEEAKEEAPAEAAEEVKQENPDKSVAALTEEIKSAEVANQKAIVELEEKALSELKSAPAKKGEKTNLPAEVAKLFDGAGVSPSRKVASPSPTGGSTAPVVRSPLKWTLQVGSYPTEEEAQSVINTLKAKGIDSAYFEETHVKGTMWYRVGVGRFINPGEAQTEGKKLRDSGLISSYFTRKLEK